MIKQLCLYTCVVHKCNELVIKHQFFKNNMVSIFHNMIITIYETTHVLYE